MVNLASTPGFVAVPAANTVAAAAVLNQDAGTIALNLTTALNATCTLTVQCNQVTPNSVISVECYNDTFVNPANGAVIPANSQGDPSIGLVKPGNGVFTVTIANRSGTQALNGGVKVPFIVFN